MYIASKPESQPATDGEHVGVCVDYEDKDMNTKHGPKHNMRLAHLLEERDSSGRSILIWSLFNRSVHKKSNFIECIRAHGCELDERGGFDPEDLIGRTCRVRTRQRSTASGTFANVVEWKRSAPGDPVIPIPLDYVRVKDRAEGTNFPS